MNVIKNKKTRALVLIMSALVVSGIVVTKVYYANENKSVDPRVVSARSLYEKYNLYAQNSLYDSIFQLMDSIEQIYNSVDHYKNSFETGVLYNNRSASYLTMALYSASNLSDSIAFDSLLNLAELNARKSIEIYDKWLLKYSNKSKEELAQIVADDFYYGLESFDDGQKSKFYKKRIKEIQDAQIETPRRLSVSYTNLGIIYRHRLLYEDAANYYKQAIDLWERNITAENNLNVLLGRPLTKRNFIQKMFPSERK